MADVICPQCGERYHETTDDFVFGSVATGNMFRLKQFYVDNGWDSFPQLDVISFGDLECPGCGGSYVTIGGKVKIDMAQYEAELFAEYDPELPAIKPVAEKRRPGRPRK